MPTDDGPVLVIGSHGQLGAELLRQLGSAAVGLDRDEVDITDPHAVRRTLATFAPRIVYNAAAYTAVDRAEIDREACFDINVGGTDNLAKLCRELNAMLVQFSSDYVFGADKDRQTPYREDDSPGPQGIYAQSKLAGEHAAATCPRHLIVRTCGLYVRRTNDRQRHFVDTMLALAAERDELRVVNDQVCTPSYVPHVAAAAIALARRDCPGIFHVTNSGETTWYALAQEIVQMCDLPARVRPITTADYGAPAPRPAYSVLDNSRLINIGIGPLPQWRDALAEYLASIGPARTKVETAS